MQDPWKLQKCFNFTDGETEITKVMLLLQPLDMFNYTWVKHVDVYTHTHTHMYVYVCLLDCPNFIWILCDILYVYLFIFIYLMQFSFLLILKINKWPRVVLGHNMICTNMYNVFNGQDLSKFFSPALLNPYSCVLQ